MQNGRPTCIAANPSKAASMELSERITTGLASAKPASINDCAILPTRSRACR